MPGALARVRTRPGWWPPREDSNLDNRLRRPAPGSARTGREVRWNEAVVSLRGVEPRSPASETGSRPAGQGEVAERRLVGESNPSHSMDSGAATPVASRGENPRPGWRTGIEPASAHSQSALVARRVPPPEDESVGRRGVAPRSPGFQPGAITRLAPDPMCGLQRKESNLQWTG